MAHIPSGTTQELELVTFRQALEAADTPSDDLHWHQPLHGQTRRAGQYPQIRGAHCLGERV